MSSPTYQFLHSTYWKSKQNDEDAVIAVLKDLDTNELKLKPIINPKRTIGISKKGIQSSHDSKKVYEDVNNLDMFSVPNHNLREELQRLLVGHTKGYTSMKQLLNSPYVYGADIDIQVLIKQHFLSKSDRVASSFRVGGLDIETAVPGVMGGREVLMITYVTPELKVHTAVLDAFIKTTSVETIKEKFFKELKSYYSKLNKETKAIFDTLKDPNHECGLEYNLTVHKTEVDMIKHIFSVIHKDKPEFISIWNMGYDIPFLLGRLSVFNVWPHQIMCHPDVNKKYRVCNYKADTNKKLAHFTFKWDMFELSGYTQFYDSMCLYSRMRKSEGMEDSYALENISTKVLGVGKMEHDNHYNMQTYRQDDYTVYNAFDSINIVLIEKRVKDIPSMMMLISDTDIGSFAQQTVQLRNWFYNYCKAHNKMPASWMGKILQDTDELIENTGGNVLSPGLAWRTGVNKIKELIGCTAGNTPKLIMLASDNDVALNNIGAFT